MNKTALAEFVSSHAEIDALLTRLRSAHDDHFFANPDKINWADVGDIKRIKIALQEIIDMIFSEGEYQP